MNRRAFLKLGALATPALPRARITGMEGWIPTEQDETGYEMRLWSYAALAAAAPGSQCLLTNLVGEESGDEGAADLTPPPVVTAWSFE